ncbi:Chorion peroxidase [Nymphon striatum]|nr:Chorion peroxidase [Nymphon striatum]
MIVCLCLLIVFATVNIEAAMIEPQVTSYTTPSTSFTPSATNIAFADSEKATRMQTENTLISSDDVTTTLGAHHQLSQLHPSAKSVTELAKYANDAAYSHASGLTDAEKSALLNSEINQVDFGTSGLTNPDCSSCSNADSDRYRTASGSCNNVNNCNWGTPTTTFRRILSATYDGNGNPTSNTVTPFQAKTSCFGGEDLLNDRGLSVMVMQWGQYIAHDISATPIASRQREQMNMVTAFIDGSPTYGSTTSDMNGLRQTTSNGTLTAYLKTWDKNTSEFPPTDADQYCGGKLNEQKEHKFDCFVAGIPFLVCKLLHHILFNLKYRIRQDSLLSASFQCDKGTPQGDPLSPLLFSLFLADLPDYLDFDGLSFPNSSVKIHLLMYADDIVLLAEDANQLQTALDCRLPKCSVSINGHDLERVPTFVYLGIVFTPQLSFTKHIERCVSKANARLESALINSALLEKGLPALYKSAKTKTNGSTIPISRLHSYANKLFSSDSSYNTFMPIPSCDQNNHSLMSPFLLSELIKILKSVKSKAPSATDCLSPHTLKLLHLDIAPLLLRIFNYALSTGYFPECWLETVLFFLHKNGSKSDPSNYRTIAIENPFLKVFMLLINSRMTQYAESESLLPDFQFGFRPNRNCMSAVSILFEMSKARLVNHKRTYCAFMDFSKAFDKIDRNLLFQKLQLLGFPRNFCQLIFNILKNLNFRVRQDTLLSPPFKSKIGTPQGDPISPLLFSLYIADLPSSLAPASVNFPSDIPINCLLYADDTCLIADTADELQLSLDSLTEYCKINHLIINVSKSKVVVFHKGDTRPNIHLGMMLIHTLLLREHNAIVAKIEESLDSRGLTRTSDEVFNEARRILGAFIQVITFEQYLPLILGPDLMTTYELNTENRTSYSSSVDPSVFNSFATAAFRMGHSQIYDNFKMAAHLTGVTTNPIQLSQLYFNPDRPNEHSSIVVRRYVLGMIYEAANAVDKHFIPDISEPLMFQSKDRNHESRIKIGLDLAALNIQRGRDHGLPKYSDWKNYFDQFDSSAVSYLADSDFSIYGGEDNADLYVAGMLESHLANAEVGKTFGNIIALQFRHFMYGDRYFYNHNNVNSAHIFNEAQIAELKKIKISQMICKNADLINASLVTDDVFHTVSDSNLHTTCKNVLPNYPDIEVLISEQF